MVCVGVLCLALFQLFLSLPVDSSTGPSGLAPNALRRSRNTVPAKHLPLITDSTAAFAEFVYANQLRERTSFPEYFSEALGRLNANYPCVYGESLIGTPSLYGEGARQFRDGWKWLCGLQRLQALTPAEGCVVYSLGSAGMMDFEADLLSKLPLHCEVHIFDRDNEVDDDTTGHVAHQSFSANRALAQYFPDASTRSRGEWKSFVFFAHTHSKILAIETALEISLTHTHTFFLFLFISHNLPSLLSLLFSLINGGRTFYQFTSTTCS